MLKRLAFGLAASFVIGSAAAMPAATVGPTDSWMISLGTGANDCGGRGGLGNCYAFQGGTRQGAPSDPADLGSRAVFKIEQSGSTETASGWSGIDGSEFRADHTGDILTFSYTPAADDPHIFYVSVKQSNEFLLLYYANGFALDFVELTVFAQAGWSHIIFFDGNATAPGGGDPGFTPVPTPGAALLFGAGLLGLAVVRRSRRAAI